VRQSESDTVEQAIRELAFAVLSGPAASMAIQVVGVAIATQKGHSPPP
jgi:hypothetical protein